MAERSDEPALTLVLLHGLFQSKRHMAGLAR